MAGKANRFAKGSACYTCSNCKKLTRSTGRGDNEHVGLCADCYDRAGEENEVQDNGCKPEDITSFNLRWPGRPFQSA